jgi:hypothetical protein
MRVQQEKPQKVRQVMVPLGLDSFFTRSVDPARQGSMAGISIADPTGGDPTFPGPAGSASEEESARQDQPLFSCDRSLRRQLDAAYEDCNRSSMAGWFEGLLHGLLGK